MDPDAETAPPDSERRAASGSTTKSPLTGPMAIRAPRGTFIGMTYEMAAGVHKGRSPNVVCPGEVNATATCSARAPRARAFRGSGRDRTPLQTASAIGRGLLREDGPAEDGCRSGPRDEATHAVAGAVVQDGESLGGSPDLRAQVQIDMLRVQMSHGYRVAYYAAYFGVGASFEVFALTLLLTALLIAGGIGLAWSALIVLYLLTGVGFVAFGVSGSRGSGMPRRLS